MPICQSPAYRPNRTTWSKRINRIAIGSYSDSTQDADGCLLVRPRAIGILQRRTADRRSRTMCRTTIMTVPVRKGAWHEWNVTLAGNGDVMENNTGFGDSFTIGYIAGQVVLSLLYKALAHNQHQFPLVERTSQCKPNKTSETYSAAPAIICHCHFHVTLPPNWLSPPPKAFGLPGWRVEGYSDE
jgi:hypothetical protein